MIDLVEYQKEIVATRIVKKDKKIDYLCYASLGLCEEAGEIAGKLKKIVRDKDGIISEEDRLSLIKEAGDTLWYLADLCDDLGVTIEEVARINLDKVRDRFQRGVIQGQGDNR